MNVFYEVIVDRVISTDVMVYLQQLSAVEPKVNELRRLDKDGKYKEAMVILLDLVDKSGEVGKWRFFIDSLEGAEYNHLYNCLEYLEDIPNIEGEKQYKLIGIFIKSIITQVGLEHSGILPLLYEKRVITGDQFQTLRNCLRYTCEQDAWLDLFSYIHKRSNNWYYVLLEAFITSGHTELVNTIDPEFLSEKDGREFNYEKLDYEESVSTGSGDACEDGVCIGNDVQQLHLNNFSTWRPSKSKLDTDCLSNMMGTSSYKKVTEVKEINIPVGEEEKLPHSQVQTTELSCRKPTCGECGAGRSFDENNQNVDKKEKEEEDDEEEEEEEEPDSDAEEVGLARAVFEEVPIVKKISRAFISFF